LAPSAIGHCLLAASEANYRQFLEERIAAGHQPNVVAKVIPESGFASTVCNKNFYLSVKIVSRQHLRHNLAMDTLGG
jgi:hypothetical protein